jgi:spore cortex formation protein SpoVR/YcgB (stage V sporulation)
MKLMSTVNVHNLPDDLRAIQLETEAHARAYGLDFYDTIFEVLDYDELSEIAALGGFPTRYPHWRFGMEYQHLAKGYRYGLQKIYEMVINNDPCYAYLLRCNGGFGESHRFSSARAGEDKNREWESVASSDVKRLFDSLHAFRDRKQREFVEKTIGLSKKKHKLSEIRERLKRESR